MGVVSPKLRDSARGQECAFRIPGVCIGGRDTTVLCHLPSEIGGKATKGDDWHAAFGCSSCHDAIDGRRGAHFDRRSPDIFRCMLDALQRTHRIWFELGLITIAGTEEPKPRPTSNKIMPRPTHFRR